LGSIERNEGAQRSTSATGNGVAGNITLDAGNQIAIANNSEIRSNANNGFAGIINLQADNDIDISDSEIKADSQGVDSSGSGGEINITAEAGAISLNRAVLDTRTTGEGFAGTMTFTAGDSVEIISSKLSAESPGLANFSSNDDSKAIAITAASSISLDGVNFNTNSTDEGFAGNIDLDAGNQITIANNSKITSNANDGVAGEIELLANNDINVTNSDIKAESRGSDNSGVGGEIDIRTNTGSIILNNRAQLNTSATGNGFAGFIVLQAGNQIAIANNSEIRSNANNGVAGTINLQANNSVNITNGEIQAQSRGSDTIGGGSIEITANTGSIALNEGARLNTSATGDGFAGNIHLDAGSEIVLADDSEIRSNANNGIAGFIDLQANNSVEVNNSKLRAESRGADDFGVGGFIRVTAETNSISLDGATVSTTATGSGVAGFINLASGNQIVTKDSNIQSNAANGLAGAIDLQADSSIFFTNTKITADSEPVSGGILINGEQGDGGDISINSWSLVMNDSAISSNSRGDGNAGNITLNIVDNLHLDNSEITADSTQAGGGDINITAYDSRLRNGSLISSSVANGDGGGGNISITSPLFLALEDSDILANANQGAGGNININSAAFLADLFGSGNAVAVGSNPGDFNQFRGNGRVDISASSQVAGLSGQVSFPDFSFLQYSLSQLSANFVNPEQAIAGSCLARRNTQQGSFTVTGTGGLPPTPNNTFSSQYRLRGVQSVGEGNVSQNQVQPTAAIPNWQIGDPVIEAQGLIATADGRIVLGNEPQLGAMVGVEDVVCE
ncbi:MAG: S-layer family protein, partial [Symploca sp. SIO1A3]|nr:S-layer family protein [Symploca sp. SIO1A3]